MHRWMLALTFLGLSSLAAETSLPVLPEGRHELHGALGSERFWLRVGADWGEGYPELLQGLRLIEVLYPQPTTDVTGGAIISDVPRVLVDDHLRVQRWREPGQSYAVALHRPEADAEAGFPGYAVVREVEVVTPEVVWAEEDQRVISGPPAWDRRLMLPLLAMAWRSGSVAAVPVVDLWGDEAAGTLTWQDTAVTFPDGTEGNIQADEAGRLAAVTSADGEVLLSVAGWLAQP